VICARLAFENGTNASTVVTLRCLFALVAFGIALRLRSGGEVTASRDRRFIVILGILFALNVYAFYKAIELLKVPLAVLTFYVYPLMTGVVSALAGLERMSGRLVAFGLVSLAGLALATGAAPESLDVLGVVLALVAAAIVATTLVLTARRVPHVDPLRRSYWMMLSTSVVIAAAMLGTGSFQWPNSVTGMAGIAGVCVFYAVGLIGLFTSATRIGPIRTAAMMNLEPVIAIALSTVVLNQGLSGLQYAGGVLVMVGVVGAQLSRMPASSRSAGKQKL
jgi:drug/metabolite transporter (DMT)-like permease